MRRILVLGAGASGLAAALAAAQNAPSGVAVTVLERGAKAGKKLLATGSGRCNLDNAYIGLDKYFTSSPRALRALLAAVERAAPLEWFASLGLYTRTDEAGRIYPYSNQASDVLALLEGQLKRYGVEVLTGCSVCSIASRRTGYAVTYSTAGGQQEMMFASAVICALGGEAGPQFGTDGFGIQLAAGCGGRVEPVYPCLTALKCARPHKALAGIRAKANVRLLDGQRVIAEEDGEVQFTDYGLSGICIMQLSCRLSPQRGPKEAAVEVDLFPSLSESGLAALLAARVPALPQCTAADLWLGLLNMSLGRAVWEDAGFSLSVSPNAFKERQWARLARTAKHWRFEGLTPCGWRQAQTTGGGLSLENIDPATFALKGSRGLYFVGETLDCAGSCGGYNLHWAFGSGIAAGRSAAALLARQQRGAQND